MTPHALRRRVQAALLAAVAASVAANILAAEPTTVARAVAAWPPIALLLTIDVLGRVPKASGPIGWATTIATGLVASVAGLASFAHVRHVALEVGESELVAWVLPLSIDGLAVVCSIALVELNQPDPTPTADPSPMPSRSEFSNDKGLRPLLFAQSSPPAVVGNGTHPKSESETLS